MKKKRLQPSFLQSIYFIIILILFGIIICTPTLIKGPLNISSKLIVEEETIEGVLLLFLLIIGFLILKLYRHESDKQKEMIRKISDEKKRVNDRLTDTEQYIGITNVQIQEIKHIFNSIEKFPETKDDFNKAVSFFSERVIGIVNPQWVLFRIIDRNTQRTFYEYSSSRPGISYSLPHISNKMVIEKKSIVHLTYLISNPKNLNILAFCIIPVDRISNDQNVFIQAIINEITKLFVILNSLYNKKEDKIYIEEKLSDSLAK
jgi:hypothetical protein